MLLRVSVLLCILCACAGDDTFDEKVHRPHWATCKPSDTFPPAANLDKKWFEEKDKVGWYYVMSHRFHVMSLTKALTGTYPASLDSVKKACFTNQRTPSGFLVTGYGNTAEYDCAEDAKTKRKECTPTHGSTDEKWAANRGTSESTVVWTDNEHCVLGVRCAAMTKIWSLRCTENADVDPTVKKIVIGWLEAAEFKAETAVTLPRGGCPKIQPIKLPELKPDDPE